MNYEDWVTVMCACRFFCCKQRTALVVDEGKGYEFAGTVGIWEISVPSSQFCCEPKAALKKKRKKIAKNIKSYSLT